MSGLNGGQDARLRYFGHVKWRSIDSLVKRCERLTMIGLKRGRGRPRKNWRDVIRQNMTYLQLTEDMNLVRRIWRSRIMVEG